MPTDIGLAVFVTLAAIWLFARIALRRRIRTWVESGRLTVRQAGVIYAASFAVLPLLALPWRNSPVDIAVLLAAAAVLFVGGVTIVWLATKGA